MTLKDGFKGVIGKIARSTIDFKKNVDTTNKSVKVFKNSTGQLGTETSRYKARVDAASNSIKSYAASTDKLRNGMGQYSTKARQAVKETDGLKTSMNGFFKIGGSSFNAVCNMILLSRPAPIPSP